MTTARQILILGHGEMGQAMDYLLKSQHTIDIWEKFPRFDFPYVSLQESVPRADIVLFCLPVNPHREVAQAIASLLKNDCLCVSIAKGLDESGKTAAQIFAENLPAQQPYALLYGPMISEEIRAGRHAFAQLGCHDLRSFETMRDCFRDVPLLMTHSCDIAGISWSVILKNVYAMAFGMADELKLGDNVRGFLVVVALQELNRIVIEMGGHSGTPYHLAGLGDLITTATSISSHHHELGRKLARGETTGITGEGPHTLKMIHQYQLFEIQQYPLFQLIHSAVQHSENVRGKFEDYFEQFFQDSQNASFTQ